MHRLHCTFWINAAAWNPGDGWGNQNMDKSQNREFLSQMFVCMFFAEAHIFSSYTKPHKHVQKQANSAHKGLCHFLFAFTLSACSHSVSFLCLSLSEYFSIDEPITDDNTVQHQHPFSLSLSPSLQHTHTHTCSLIRSRVTSLPLLCTSVHFAVSVCVQREAGGIWLPGVAPTNCTIFQAGYHSRAHQLTHRYTHTGAMCVSC